MENEQINLQINSVENCNLRWGALVTLWTAFIASYSLPVCIPLVMLLTSVHLSPSSPSCIKFHQGCKGSPESSLCRLPLEYDPSPETRTSVPSLTTLETFLTSASRNGMSEVKLLVCIGSIGPQKTVPVPRRDTTAGLVEGSIFDETSCCIMTVWGDKIPAARTWIPNKTILLLTNPTVKPSQGKGIKPSIGLGFPPWLTSTPASTTQVGYVSGQATRKRRNPPYHASGTCLGSYSGSHTGQSRSLHYCLSRAGREGHSQYTIL